MNKPEVWNPWTNILGSKITNYAIIILNRPLKPNLPVAAVLDLWNKASVRVTVDGGTDRWLTWLKVNNCDTKMVKRPDLVTGDMDSISRQTLQYYVEVDRLTQVKITPDQSETDFTKSLRELKEYCLAKNIRLDAIFVMADTSGRIDQIIANINTLHKLKNILGKMKVYQLAADSITWLLWEGEHNIIVPKIISEQREWCALMPIGAACRVTTAGLKWNLNNVTMEFGKLVSTSNTYSGEPVVSVKTDGPVVWSMGIDSLNNL